MSREIAGIKKKREYRKLIEGLELINDDGIFSCFRDTVDFIIEREGLYREIHERKTGKLILLSERRV